MTVGELVEKLNKCPMDYEVVFDTAGTDLFQGLREVLGPSIETMDGSICAVELYKDIEMVFLTNCDPILRGETV